VTGAMRLVYNFNIAPYFQSHVPTSNKCPILN